MIGAQYKDLVETRWVLTWKEVHGLEAAKAGLVAKGNDLRA